MNLTDEEGLLKSYIKLPSNNNVNYSLKFDQDFYIQTPPLSQWDHKSDWIDCNQSDSALLAKFSLADSEHDELRFFAEFTCYQDAQGHRKVYITPDSFADLETNIMNSNLDPNLLSELKTIKKITEQFLENYLSTLFYYQLRHSPAPSRLNR